MHTRQLRCHLRACKQYRFFSSFYYLPLFPLADHPCFHHAVKLPLSLLSLCIYISKDTCSPSPPRCPPGQRFEGRKATLEPFSFISLSQALFMVEIVRKRRPVLVKNKSDRGTQRLCVESSSSDVNLRADEKSTGTEQPQWRLSCPHQYLANSYSMIHI